MTTPATKTSLVQSAPDADRTPEGTRSVAARLIVRHNVYWALGLGLVPLPILDFVALTAVQVKMLKQLSEHYEVKFFEDKALTLIGSLVTGTGSLALAGMFAHSFLKLVPVVGPLIGFLGVPLFAGALTQAMGNLFMMHFESGGTLLNFDPNKMRAHFQQEFADAKVSVKQLQTDPQGKPAVPHP